MERKKKNERKNLMEINEIVKTEILAGINEIVKDKKSGELNKIVKEK